MELVPTMPNRPLTARQRMLLNLIRRHFETVGYAPTISELRRSLGLRSLRGVTVHLDKLHNLGYIRRDFGECRGIALLKDEAGRCIQVEFRASE